MLGSGNDADRESELRAMSGGWTNEYVLMHYYDNAAGRLWLQTDTPLFVSHGYVPDSSTTMTGEGLFVVAFVRTDALGRHQPFPWPGTTAAGGSLAVPPDPAFSEMSLGDVLRGQRSPKRVVRSESKQGRIGRRAASVVGSGIAGAICVASVLFIVLFVGVNVAGGLGTVSPPDSGSNPTTAPPPPTPHLTSTEAIMPEPTVEPLAEVVAEVTPEPAEEPVKEVVAEVRPDPTEEPTPRITKDQQRYLDFVWHAAQGATDISATLGPLGDALISEDVVSAIIYNAELLDLLKVEQAWLKKNPPAKCYKHWWNDYKGIVDLSASTSKRLQPWLYDYPYGSISEADRITSDLLKAHTRQTNLNEHLTSGIVPCGM